MLSIDKTSIVPFFQPIVCVDTCDIFGYEVLGRYCSEAKIHSLGQFFHNSGICFQDKVQVDRVIRFKALEMIKNLNHQAKFFINIQPEWLMPFADQDKIMPTIEQMDKYNINGEKIIIEICEDSFTDIYMLLELVKRYRDVGCKIAIDDVGAGCSNLERIAVLNPDYLKISAGFISRSKSFNILESIGEFCEKSGVSLVLEEIEDMNQLQMGLDAGVRYLQGYFFAAPQPNILEGTSCSTKVEQGLEQYWNRKQQLLQKHIQRSDSMNSLVNDTVNEAKILYPTSSPNNYVRHLFTFLPDYCTRIYICDHHGVQLTPNYTRNQNEWQEKLDYIGRNWCWRPYFFSQVAEARRTGRGVLSESYLDLESRKPIHTFIFPVNTNLFLFIDCCYSGIGGLALDE